MKVALLPMIWVRDIPLSSIVPVEMAGRGLDGAVDEFKVNDNIAELPPVLPVERQAQYPAPGDCMLNAKLHLLGKDEVHLEALSEYGMR